MNRISGKVLPPVQKSARILGKVYPTGVKSKPNLRHDFPHRAKVRTESRARFCHPCKSLPEILARFYPLGYGLPEISGIFSPPKNGLSQNQGQTIITIRKHLLRLGDERAFGIAIDFRREFFCDFLFYLLGDGNLLCLGILAFLVVDLQGVDEFGDTVEQGTPAKDEHGHGRGIHRTDDDVEAREQDDAGQYPVAEAYLAEMTGVEQVHELVDGTQDEDAADDIHQSCDKDIRGEGQKETEDGAADTYDGEGGLADGDTVTLGIGDVGTIRQGFLLGHLTERVIIDHHRDDARQEEQYTDDNCNPCDGVVGVLDEHDADGNGADGAENGTLEYLHIVKVFKFYVANLVK